MISRETFSQLLSFDPGDYLTTTLYLRIDSSPQQSHLIRLKELIKHGRKELDAMKPTTEVAKSVQEDLRKITDFVNLEFSREGARTLVVISCSAKKFWKIMTLNVPVRSRLVVNSGVYWRPLSFVLDEHSRYLVIIIERSKARLFEVYAGDIIEHTSILDQVPGRVREAGFAGYEERRIERHIEDHVRRHMKHVADGAFESFKKHSIEHIVLLGTEQNTSEFRHFLPQVMQDRVVAAEVEEITASPQKILEHTQRIENQNREKQEREIVRRLFDQVNSDGLGIVGLDATIRALAQGQVNYIVLREGFQQAGYRCMECRSLRLKNGNCDYCGAATQQVADLVDETVHDAFEQGCQVKYITIPDPALESAGKIGAILRFKF